MLCGKRATPFAKFLSLPSFFPFFLGFFLIFVRSAKYSQNTWPFNEFTPSSLFIVTHISLKTLYYRLKKRDELLCIFPVPTKYFISFAWITDAAVV